MIGIFGGTFDPVHHGHLRVAVDIQEQLQLQEVRWMPLNIAVHRPQPQASAAQRLQMLQLAIAGQATFVVDDRELRRPGPSYSYQSLEELRQELGARLPLCLLLGSDAVAAFPSWKQPERILELAHLVVFSRPGFPSSGIMPASWMQKRLTTDASALNGHPGGTIYSTQASMLEIASTHIRALRAHGQSVRYLVPDAVAAFLHHQHLYCGTPARQDKTPHQTPPGLAPKL